MKIFDFVLSKCFIKDGQFTSEYRQPFDLFTFYNKKESDVIEKTSTVMPVHQLWRGWVDALRNFLMFESVNI